MSLIDNGFEALNKARSPELWEKIRQREPSPMRDGPSSARRLGTIALAFVIAAAGLTFGIRALRPDRQTDANIASPAGPEATIVGPVPVGPLGQATTIVAAADVLWVAYYDEQGEHAHVAQLDPATLELIRVIDGIPIPTWETGGGGMAPTSDGKDVWVGGTRDGQAILTRLDGESGAAEAETVLTGSSVADISSGAFGDYVLEQGKQPGSAIIETIDPFDTKVVHQVMIPALYGRRILQVGGYIVVLGARYVDGEPFSEYEMILLDWERFSYEHVIDRRRTHYFEDLASDEFSDSGWAANGSRIFELDGVGLLHEMRAIDLPSGNALTVTGGPGGVWVATERKVYRIDPTLGQVDVDLSLPEGFEPIASTWTEGSLYLLGWDGSVVAVQAPSDPSG